MLKDEARWETNEETLTTPELSRAGPTTQHNLDLPDEFRCATGDGSGDVVRRSVSHAGYKVNEMISGS